VFEFTKLETKMKNNTFDLVGLAAWLNKNSLMEKPFSRFSTTEIENLCEAIHLHTIPVEYRVPYLKNRVLIMPTPTHPRFEYWKDGQTLFETLKEMGADPEIVKRYCPAGDRKPKPRKQEN